MVHSVPALGLLLGLWWRRRDRSCWLTARSGVWSKSVSSVSSVTAVAENGTDCQISHLSDGGDGRDGPRSRLRAALPWRSAPRADPNRSRSRTPYHVHEMNVCSRTEGGGGAEPIMPLNKAHGIRTPRTLLAGIRPAGPALADEFGKQSLMATGVDAK